jgi:hypothetical protein
MRRKLPLFLLLVTVAASGSAFAKSKKPSVSEAFQTAHTIFVESRDGDITDLRLEPDDRKAILDMQDGIHDWGRYTLSRSRIDADLILVVHKGRLLRDPSSAGNLGSPRVSPSHVPIHDPADASQGTNDNGSPDGLTREKDELRVYTIQPNGKLKGPIWSDEVDRGLNSPNILLLQRLKIYVEKAYPAVPPNKQPTP